MRAMARAPGALTFVLAAIWLVLHAGVARAVDLAGATSGELGVTPNGSLSYSIPISVPPGTTGVQPQLTLQYDSLGGNGIMGMGWTVGGLSNITRCPTNLHMDAAIDPVDFDVNDKFCLNGQRLVPVTGTAGTYGAVGQEYRTSFEEFSRIVSVGGTSGNPLSFQVWKKSGEILEYGVTADARVEKPGGTQVRLWALNKLSDRLGNYVEFKYAEDNATGQFRIDEVNYTGNAVLSRLPYNKVDFVYEARPDTIKGYAVGDPFGETQRLKNVIVYAEGQIFRDYRITYELSFTGRSRPSNIKECTATDCFPATTFGWTPAGTADIVNNPVPAATSLTKTQYSSYSVVASGDFNGDGLVDMVIAHPHL
jgi:hypothetical protein